MDFIIRHKTNLAFIAFSLFCIVSLSVQSSSFTLTFEGIGSMFLYPFQKGYDLIQEGASTFWAGFTELQEIKEELRETKTKLQEYENLSEKEIIQENIRLRKLLRMREHIPYEYIPCSIISKDPDNWYRTIIINRGSDDGIDINMPVISYYGGEKIAFGKVTEVRGGISRIQPVISNKMKLGVMFQDSRHAGLLSSYNYSAEFCVMDYIKKSITIQTGDKIITSGQGGIFPKGILVGIVVKSFLNESGTFQKAIIKPFIDYSNIEELFVIKKKPDPELMELIKSEEQ